VSLVSVVVCDLCKTVGATGETDSEASEAVAKLGWTMRRVKPAENRQGKGIIDVCPSCNTKEEKHDA